MNNAPPALCFCGHPKHGQTCDLCSCIQFAEMTPEGLNHRKHLLEKQERLSKDKDIDFFKDWSELAEKYALLNSRVNYYYCKMHAERYAPNIPPVGDPAENYDYDWQNQIGME